MKNQLTLFFKFFLTFLKFDTVPFCIMSYFDHFRHFRIVLEFPNFLGRLLHVMINRTFQESNKNSIFHINVVFSRLVHVLFTKMTLRNVEILVNLQVILSIL